ncbi:carbohydrate ABC transporter permease [Aeropyrum camini]|uniref:ABC transporter permease n=1 Tax=Aeropyrum camini SY1 = JCM 12091 TaxID=1198449 RepID=U3TGM4_9CREN|nr:sugar ABC transporter permease [Aeropyrum camini]BAN90494.1 ABC transporter permease [Aeropyrum camini SY1 = JCM 12091]
MPLFSLLQDSRVKAWLLLSPTILYLTVFIAYPIVDSFRIAFVKNGSLSFDAVDFLLYSPLSEFWSALKYTFLLAILVIPTETLLALTAVILLFKRFRGRDAVIYVLVMPLALSDLAAGLIWYSMLTGKGFLNKLLLNLGLISEPIIFFGYENRWLTFLAVYLAEVWRSTAIVFVILFAGAQLINREVFEAAEVFGASFYVKLRHILIPMIKPSLQAALLIRTLFAFQVFAVVWILAGRDIPVLAGEAYYSIVELHKYDVAALYAIVIALLSASIGLIYIRVFRETLLR